MLRIVRFITMLALALAVVGTSVGVALGQPVTAGPVVIDGTISMIVEDDFLKGHTKKRHFLDDPATKAHHEIKLSKDQADALQPGMKVRVTGDLVDGVISADGVYGGVYILDGTVAAGAPVTARKVLVLLVDIKDSGNVMHTISSNCDGSIDKAASNAFGFNTTAASVNGCYQDSSYGQLGWGGTSYPGTDVDVRRVTISDDPATCDYTSYGSKADAAVGSSVLSNYWHRVYVVPSDTSCGWAGVAYVNACPGSYCQAWVKAYSEAMECGYIDAMAHEVGHNIGLMHASYDTNNDGTNDCEYCDDADFMGYAEGTLRPLNGPHRVQMGWVTGSGIVDASAGGTFTLSELNQRASPFPQVARITPSSGSPYYLSYRVGDGYDSSIGSSYYSAAVLNRISVHRWPGGINNTFFITALAEGDIFTDSANHISITPTSHDASTITFTVGAPIAMPTNLRATAGDAQVALSWTASAGANSYNVKRATSSGGPYSPIKNATATSYADTGLVNGQTYYYVVSAMIGANESPNSAAVSATPNGIDLVTTAVSNPPAQAAPGGSFSVTDTVKNNGLATAGASTSRYYLSSDQTIGGDTLLSGTRAVLSLAAGQTSSGTVTVTIPSSTTLGNYYLLSCADDVNNAVTETNESNNCKASTTTVQVALIAPDLAVTAISIPTTPVGVGGTFKVTDTVVNQGTVAAGAFLVRYYLSSDPVNNVPGNLVLGSRSVSSLSTAQSSNGNVTVTVPSGAFGSYYVLSCADDGKAIAETNESNNCKASGSTIQVTLPDLIVTAITIPATPVAPGGTFKISDTVKNQGTVAAGAFTRRYYLSSDTTLDKNNDFLLDGTDSDTSLTAGQTSNANVNVTVPSAARGPYYVFSCVDDLNTVAELDEGNNCKMSAGTIQVTPPDLTVTAVTDPPASASVGTTFRVTDTVKNAGLVAAGASTTRYYLRKQTTAELLLTGSRSVSSINAGATSSGNANVTIATGTPAGTYYLLACADDMKAVSELDDGNNCLASANTVVVH